MRDITPSQKPSFSRKDIPEELPPEAKKLYEKHAEKAAARKSSAKTSSRRFTGSQIPITNVHIPKQTLPEKPASRQQENEEDVDTEKRPLFAVVDNIAPQQKKAKKKKPSKAAMMLGTKETKIALSLLAVVLLTAGIAAFIFLPSATIDLRLQTAPLLVDQKLTIASNTASEPNTVPGTVFSQQIRVEGASPVTTTEIVGTKAKGTVRIFNKTFDVQKIKEKSRLVTKDGTLFYMLGSEIIPASSDSNIASATVEVEAAEAGEKGNITPQHLNFAALDSSAQTVVYGQAESTLTGGSGQEVKVVADSDIDQAHEAAKAQAKAQVEAAAHGQLQSGWSILDESWDVQLSNFAPGQKTGDKADTISFTV